MPNNTGSPFPRIKTADFGEGAFMIIEVKEINYNGFHIQHEERGWKIVLKDEYLFPTLQDAQCAVDEFLGDVVKKHRGKKMKKKA